MFCCRQLKAWQICKKCNVTFPSKALQVRHMTECHTSGYYVCVHCEDRPVYRTFARLALHLDLEHEISHVNCILCGELLDTDYSVVANHLKKHNTYCTECNRYFKTRNHYIAHHDAVHKNIHYKCKLCKKAYKSMRYLTYHIKSHDPLLKKLILVIYVRKNTHSKNLWNTM